MSHEDQAKDYGKTFIGHRETCQLSRQEHSSGIFICAFRIK